MPRLRYAARTNTLPRYPQWLSARPGRGDDVFLPLARVSSGLADS
jgi:hypothetical protein